MKFIELTKEGGKKITVNLQNVVSYEKAVNSQLTCVDFVNKDSVFVNETVLQIWQKIHSDE